MAEFAEPTYNVTYSPENEALEAYWDDLPTLKIIEVEKKIAGFAIKHSYEVADFGDPNGDVVLWFWR